MDKKLDDHYTEMGVEPIEYSYLNKLDPYQHTIVKYVTRYQAKGGMRDLKAAQLLLGKYIDRLEAASDEPVKVSNETFPKIDWALITEDLVKSIVSKLGGTVDRIVIIPRGGLTLGHAIAEGLNMKEVELFDPSIIYEGSVLLVDDINDSGETLTKIISHPNRFRSRLHTAVLAQRHSTTVTADFIGCLIHHNDYVTFPWETKDA